MSGAETVQLVLFEIGGARFAAELAQVAAIEAPVEALELEPRLGAPMLGRHALAVDRPQAARRHLCIDAVLGFQQVPLHALRRMPPFAAAPSFALGAWLADALPVLLVDLHALADEETKKAENPPMENPHVR